MKDQVMHLNNLGDHAKDDLNCTHQKDHCRGVPIPSAVQFSITFPHIKRHAYTTITHPKLGYALCAWSPHTAKATRRVESMQHEANFFCTGKFYRHQNVSAIASRSGCGKPVRYVLLQSCETHS